MRRRATPVTEILVSATKITVTGMKIFPNAHFILVTGTKKNSNTIIHFCHRTDKHLIIMALFLDFLVQNNSF